MSGREHKRRNNNRKPGLKASNRCRNRLGPVPRRSGRQRPRAHTMAVRHSLIRNRRKRRKLNLNHNRSPCGGRHPRHSLNPPRWLPTSRLALSRRCPSLRRSAAGRRS
jgi:hypothetical protein